MSLRSIDEKATAAIQERLSTEATSDLKATRVALGSRRTRTLVVPLAITTIGHRHPRAAIRVFATVSTLNHLASLYVARQVDIALHKRAPYGGTL